MAEILTVQRWLLESSIEPMPGDFLVERGRDLISSAIAWRQGGRWSHVAIPVSTLCKVEMHASGGLQANLLNFKKPWAYLRLREEYQARLDPFRWKSRLIEHSLARRKYDLTGIAGSLIGAPRMVREDALYCSGLLADLLSHAAGLQITRSHFPWPDRCFESLLYNVIGWASAGHHAEFNGLSEDRDRILNLV